MRHGTTGARDERVMERDVAGIIDVDGRVPRAEARRRRARLLLAVCVSLAACGGDRDIGQRATVSTVDTPASGAATDTARDGAADTPRDQPLAAGYRRSRGWDLTGDGRPERFVLTATGPGADSLDVRLVITDADGTVLLDDAWLSAYYFAYLDRAAMTDAAAEDTVRAQLDAVLSDSSFGEHVVRELGPTVTGSPDIAEESVQHDVASQMWREANGRPTGERLPPEAYDSVQSILRRGVDPARVEKLTREARSHGRWFRHFRGGEDTAILAWSPSERRLFTMFACC